MNAFSNSALHRSSIALALLLALCGCAQGNIKPSDTTAAAPTAISGLSEEDRVAFFVNHARNGECAEVAKSLAEGQPIDQIDSLGQTALIAAVSHNSLDCVKLLLDHQANANLPDGSGWTPLIYGAYFGANDELLTALINHGADVNGRNDRGVTALFLASASGHEDQVRFLLGHGADPRIESTAGYTPLRIAKLRGQRKIAALLDPVSSSAQDKTSVH
jgi:ankyrin repeat protein